jgi:hypothetical protein
MSKHTPKPFPEFNQNEYLDKIISGEIHVNTTNTPLSLRPNEVLMDLCVAGSEEAMAIRDSWRPSFRVTVMTSADLDDLSDRCDVVFTGQQIAGAVRDADCEALLG